MIDVSMYGTTIAINFYGSPAIKVDEFSDEGTPIEIPGLQIADGSKNLNGALVTWSKPSIPTVSFTLIPGGQDDNKLRTKLQAQALNGTGNPQEAFISSLVVSVPIWSQSNSNMTGATTTARNGYRTWTFHNGRLQSGQAAFGSNNEGKASPSTYTFMFESVDETTSTSK